MSYEPYNSDRAHRQAITKIYRARHRAAEMERLGDEMRKLQAQMNHTFPKSTEHWYDMRTHGSLQLSEGLYGKSVVELSELASDLGKRVGTTLFWMQTPEVRFRVRELLRQKRYKEVISIFELILEDRDDEVLSWFGLERETFEVTGWGESDPVRTHTQIVSADEEFRASREAEAEDDPLDRVLSLKKKVEGCTQAEAEARRGARQAKLICSVIAVGFSAGGILFSSLLASIICTIFGLIFLAGALSPIKNNSLVRTAVENREQAQGQLDRATTEWLEAEGLS